MTNEASGFSTSLSTTILGGLSLYYVRANSFQQPTPLTVISAYSTGLQCVDLPNDVQSGGWNVEWADVAPGARSGANYSYVIIRSYYTPAAPDGDQSLLNNAMFVVYNGTTRKFDSFNGPGVLPPVDIGGQYYPVPIMPLSGIQSTCRIVDDGFNGPQPECG